MTKSEITVVSSYEKDVDYFQQFLLGRSPCLAVDSADIRRIERLLEQLCLVHDRPLYKTIKGKGVFAHHPGEDPWPVVMTINEEALDDIIRSQNPPPLHPKELVAIDTYFDQLKQKNGNWIHTVMGNSTDNTDHITGENSPSFLRDGVEIPNFPNPIPITIKNMDELFVPIEVHPGELNDLVFETVAVINDFLARFRIVVRSSAGDFQPRINPKIMDPKKAPVDVIADEYTYAAEWLGSEAYGPGVLVKVGIPYGMDPEQDGDPAAITNCLTMISQALPASGIVLLMEGFKEDLPDSEGKYTPDGKTDALRDLEASIRLLEKSLNQIILVSPGCVWGQTSVASLVHAYSLNMPDVVDIDGLLRSSLGSVYSINENLYNDVVHAIVARGKDATPPDKVAYIGNMTPDERDDIYFDRGLIIAANALRGLTETRIIELVWTSMRSRRDLDTKLLDGARLEIIRKVAGLTLIEPNVGFDDVGGLDALKKWILGRGAELFMSPAESLAKGMGGDTYKGILLIGLPGTGKSLITKAIANALAAEVRDYPVSLIMLDTGSLRGQYVGQSEQQTDKALKTVEAFAPVVLWIDELEKAFASGGDSSNEIGRRMLGKFLTWMQERTAPVFLVATANDISSLPPEFTREGRLDAKFYMPLPDRNACATILKYNLKRFIKEGGPKNILRKLIDNTPGGQGGLTFMNWLNWAHSRNAEDRAEAVIKSNKKQRLDEDGQPVFRHQGYSGAEIESAVKEAMVRARAEAKKSNKNVVDVINMLHILEALQELTPVSRKISDRGQPMADLMVDLEIQGRKLLTADEVQKQFMEIQSIAKNKKIAPRGWREGDELQEITEKDYEDVLMAVGELADEIAASAPKKKKGTKRKNPAKKKTNSFLLGSEFWN